MSTRYRVIFVCTGNICRSPMAEWVLRKHVEDAGLADEVEILSGGTASWHTGQHADHRTVYALRSNGYECEHIARTFEPSWFAEADLVVTFDEDNLRTLGALARSGEERAVIRLLREFDPAADITDPGDLTVPEPYYGTSAEFAVCLRTIEAAVPGLLAEIRTALGLEQVCADPASA